MSHHSDTALAKEDPRLNVADMYLFGGQAESTAMALTTNADMGISAPDTLNEEGLYSFRVHRTESDEEDLVFKFRFLTLSGISTEPIIRTCNRIEWSDPRKARSPARAAMSG